MKKMYSLRIKKKKMSFSSIGDWNAKVGSLEIQGVTDKFALGVNK